MRNKEWFDGLKWAEQQFKELSPVVAELRVDAHTWEKYDDFAKGARDYLKHYHQTLGHAKSNLLAA